MIDYDEFGYFHENADEVGLPWNGPPRVSRRQVDAGEGRQVSALIWGGGDPELVLIHGGAQNAHTWDTVAMALDHPLVAVDLPGHGHSSWREDHRYDPRTMADDVAIAVRELAPRARLVCGMSLGGLTALCLAQQHPDLVRRLVVVDVTPGTDHAKAEPIINFISGPERFSSFDEILARTVEYNPTRSVSSLRRGILHNAKELPDGSWTWRWDPTRNRERAADATGDLSHLWEAVDAVSVPLLLVRGSLSGVVGDEDVSELCRRRPEARVIVVEGAGHSIQGDQPLEMARILAEELG